MDFFEVVTTQRGSRRLKPDRSPTPPAASVLVPLGSGAAGAPGEAGIAEARAAAPGAAGAGTARRPDLRDYASTPKLRDIHFDFDPYAIRPEDARTFDANADWILSHRDDAILIEGHCDERGTNEYNLVLGEHRALAARNYLIAHEVGADRMTTISYGEERPLCTKRREACWALNRRAHFLVKQTAPAR